jgi:arylsulfatase
MKRFYDNWWNQVKSGIDQFVPVIVGSDHENPVILDSHNWVNGAVNGHRGIANAKGPPGGGIIHINVVREGQYRVELSRWPFHLKRGLRMVGPEMTIGGTQIETGKALPIEFGCLSINDDVPIISRRTDDGTTIIMETTLSTGHKTLRAWFKDLSKKDLCGAYYVKMQRLS